MQQFIKAFEAGLLQEHLKSEPIPDENYGPLYKVVGENFDEMVADSDTDVFLEVYAPWCGHCKELAPTIKKLAKRFKDVPTVKICDMDGTVNEHPLVKDAKGFPAIYFFPRGEGRKNPMGRRGEANGRWLHEIYSSERKTSV